MEARAEVNSHMDAWTDVGTILMACAQRND